MKLFVKVGVRIIRGITTVSAANVTTPGDSAGVGTAIGTATGAGLTATALCVKTGVGTPI